MMVLPGKSSSLVFSTFGIIGIMLLLSACQASSCQDPLGCIFIQPGQNIKIGIEKATIGEERFTSASLLESLESILSDQTLAEPKIELEVFETNCSASARPQDAARISTMKDLAGVFAPACQSNNLQFLQLLSNAGLVVLSPVLVEPAQPSGIFSLLPETSVQALHLAEYLGRSWIEGDIILAVESLPELKDFAENFCSKTAARLVCRLRIRFDSLADLEALLLEANPAPDTRVLVVTQFERIGSLPEFSEPLTRAGIYFYDPSLNPLPEVGPQPVNRFIIAAFPAGQDAEPANHQFSVCFSQKSVALFVKAISNSSRTNPDGTRSFGRMAIRKSLASLLQADSNITAQNPCVLSAADFSIVPLPTAP